MKKMKVVISGSYRKYISKIGLALVNFKKSDVRVLRPLSEKVVGKSNGFVFLSTDNPNRSAGDIEKEFMVNIKKSDFMYLANIDRYVGESSATEMGVAMINGTPIVAHDRIKTFSDKIPSEVRNILKKAVFAEIPINKICHKEINKIKLKKFVPLELKAKEKILLLTLVEKLLKNLSEIKREKTSNLYLKPNPVLKDFHEYIRQMVEERGFKKEGTPEKFMLFLEECGELAKAVRKTQSKMKTDKNSEQFELEHEAADVFIYLLDICNMFNIDLEKAFRNKEEINKKRSWS